MRKLKARIRTPFASAALGGLVVALLGWVAIAAGWIEAEPAGESRVPAPVRGQAVNERGGGSSIGEIYERTAAGVAFVEAEGNAQAAPPNPFGGAVPPSTATGSGFVIDSEGHVMTNAHVVDGAEHVRVTLGDEQQSFDAELLGQDNSTDIAVLKVDAPSDVLEPLTLGDSESATVGDPVVAIGNPFGLDRTVTAGIVSALQRQITAPNGFTISDVIQTDAPINPGNSGGPLIDSRGEVIGVNSQIESSSGGNVGIGFAVPIGTAQEVAQQLISGGEVEHAFLGISGTDLDPRIANALNLDVEEGALVQSVVPDSPAAEAGIEAGDVTVGLGSREVRAGGDVIVAVDDKPVAGMDDVIGAVDRRQPGDELELTIVRGGDERTETVTLGDRPARARG